MDVRMELKQLIKQLNGIKNDSQYVFTEEGEPYHNTQKEDNSRNKYRNYGCICKRISKNIKNNIIEIVYDDTFHDRYILIDDKKIYPIVVLVLTMQEVGHFLSIY